MSPISQPKSSCFKTPTLTKGSSPEHPVDVEEEATPVDVEQEATPVAEGMLFVFSLAGGETKAYISYDPVFHGISGYQHDFKSMVTKEMIDKMTEQGKEDDPDFWVLPDGFNDEGLANFLYGYASCMDECEGGEIAKGTVVIHIHF